MRFIAAPLGLVALVVVAIGWLQNPDHITAAEALSAAEGAYAAAGLRGAAVDPDPVAGVYVAVAGGERMAVWKTSAALDGGTVQLWLARADGESVFLDDRAPDGASQVLTDAQFQNLADHYENPAAGRQIRRNLVLTLAAALVGLLSVRLSLVAGGRSAPAVPGIRAGLRRLFPFGRRRPTAAVPVSRPGPRPPPRPGRPIRARQETS